MSKNRPLASETESNPFAVRLRVAMEFSGETQTSLAEKIGIKRQTIGVYCSGQSQPNADTIARIAKALGISADWLLGLTEMVEKRDTSNDVFSFLSLEAVVALEIERNYGESSRAFFISQLLEHGDELDRLITALKSKKDGIEITVDAPDCSIPEYLEIRMRETAAKSLVEYYFWRLADKLGFDNSLWQAGV